MLILFQKFFHSKYLGSFYIQNQKILISCQKYIYIFHNRSCKYRRIFYIPHFRELIQIQFFRSID